MTERDCAREKRTEKKERDSKTVVRFLRCLVALEGEKFYVNLSTRPCAARINTTRYVNQDLEKWDL